MLDYILDKKQPLFRRASYELNAAWQAMHLYMKCSCRTDDRLGGTYCSFMNRFFVRSFWDVRILWFKNFGVFWRMFMNRFLVQEFWIDDYGSWILDIQMHSKMDVQEFWEFRFWISAYRLHALYTRDPIRFLTRLWTSYIQFWYTSGAPSMYRLDTIYFKSLYSLYTSMDWNIHVFYMDIMDYTSPYIL